MQVRMPFMNLADLVSVSGILLFTETARVSLTKQKSCNWATRERCYDAT